MKTIHQMKKVKRVKQTIVGLSLALIMMMSVCSVANATDHNEWPMPFYNSANLAFVGDSESISTDIVQKFFISQQQNTFNNDKGGTTFLIANDVLYTFNETLLFMYNLSDGSSLGTFLWTFPITKRPCIVNDRLYAVNYTHIFCYDISTASPSLIWSQYITGASNAANYRIEIGLTVHNNNILFYLGTSSNNYKLICYLDSGSSATEKWRSQTLYRSSYGLPCVAGDKVFVCDKSVSGGTYSAYIKSFSLDTGIYQWGDSLSMTASSSSSIQPVSCVSNGEYVIAAVRNTASTPNYLVYHCYTVDGTFKWKKSWSSSTGGDIIVPSMDTTSAYVMTTKQLSVYNLEIGFPLWSKTFSSSTTGISIADGKVFHCLPSPINKLIGYDINNNGNPLISISCSFWGTMYGPSVIAYGKIYQATSGGIYCFGRSLPPNTPNKPIGATYLRVGESSTYSTDPVFNPDNEPAVQYCFSWGSGSPSYSSIPSISHAWTSFGEYEVQVKAKSMGGLWSDLSEPLLVDVNGKPTTPVPLIGPSLGKVNTSIAFVFHGNSSDPEGKSISYEIDWGDGQSYQSISNIISGADVNLTLYHTFVDCRIYYIRVRSYDEHNLHSDWSSSLSVNMERLLVTVSGGISLKVFVKNIGPIVKTFNATIDVLGGRLFGVNNNFEWNDIVVDGKNETSFSTPMFFTFGYYTARITIDCRGFEPIEIEADCFGLFFYHLVRSYEIL